MQGDEMSQNNLGHLFLCDYPQSGVAAFNIPLMAVMTFSLQQKPKV